MLSDKFYLFEYMSDLNRHILLKHVRLIIYGWYTLENFFFSEYTQYI